MSLAKRDLATARYNSLKVIICLNEFKVPKGGNYENNVCLRRSPFESRIDSFNALSGSTAI